MGSEHQMPKLNLKADTEKLSKTNLSYMRLIEERNRDRVEKLKVMRRNSVFTASLLLAGVIGIYAYTIYSVKQETFLDDFNEPEKIFDEPESA